MDEGSAVGALGSEPDWHYLRPTSIKDLRDTGDVADTH